MFAKWALYHPLCRWARGSRVIVIDKDNSRVTTYVRMEDGTIIDGN